MGKPAFAEDCQWGGHLARHSWAGGTPVPPFTPRNDKSGLCTSRTQMNNYPPESIGRPLISIWKGPLERHFVVLLSCYAPCRRPQSHFPDIPPRKRFSGGLGPTGP